MCAQCMHCSVGHAILSWQLSNSLYYNGYLGNLVVNSKIHNSKYIHTYDKVWNNLRT